MFYCLCPPAERTCQVLFLGAAEDAPESLQLFDGKATQEIELPRMNLSPVYKLPSGPLILRLLEKAPQNSQDIPAGSPNTAITEEISDFYLFISYEPNNPTLPFSMRIINASPDKLRNSQMLWLNLSQKRIGGKVGSQKIMLQAQIPKNNQRSGKGNQRLPRRYLLPDPREKGRLAYLRDEMAA